MVDPVLAAIVVLMIAFVFFVYLMVRRTLTQFRQGVDRGKGGG
jgi:hypothetical protein